MPTFTERDNFGCWIRVAVVENIEALNDTEFKTTFKTEVLENHNTLFDYVNEELMPLEFPDWDINRAICVAILNTIDWCELLEDIKGDIENEDECS
jgi:hypothetical protein